MLQLERLVNKKINSNIFPVEEMPLTLEGMSVSEDPIDNASLIVIGGLDLTSNQNSNAILKLTCNEQENCKWQILTLKLEVPRVYHVSLFTNAPLNCSVQP